MRHVPPPQQTSPRRGTKNSNRLLTMAWLALRGVAPEARATASEAVRRREREEDCEGVVVLVGGELAAFCIDVDCIIRMFD